MSLENVKKYIANEQAEFLSLLESSYQAKKLTEAFYNDARVRGCNTDDWDTAFDHFARMYEDLKEQLSNPDKYFLIERIEKGEAYMKREDITPDHRTAAQRLVNQLSKELEAMMLEG